MNNKFLVQIAIFAFGGLLLAFAVIEGVDYLHPQPEETPVASGPPVTHTAVIVQQSLPINPVAVQQEQQQELQAQTPVVVQPIANSVDRAQLENLAESVHLKNLSTDRDQWKRALPKAQHLLQGACDCEQRNWLNHFVETGNEALNGSNDYQQSAKFLLTLPKNDKEATSHQIPD